MWHILVEQVIKYLIFFKYANLEYRPKFGRKNKKIKKIIV